MEEVSGNERCVAYVLDGPIRSESGISHQEKGELTTHTRTAAATAFKEANTMTAQTEKKGGFLPGTG